MRIRSAKEEDLQGILAIQRANLRDVLSSETMRTDGFLTVAHTEADLALLNKPVAHSVAVSDLGEVLGYALSMSPQHLIPVLKPMFQAFDQRNWRGKSISSLNYTVMGQVALQASCRGKGVFRRLYAHWFATQAEHYELGLTEIDAKNTRSIGAHLAVGWVEIGRNKQDNTEWIFVGKDLSTGF